MLFYNVKLLQLLSCAIYLVTSASLVAPPCKFSLTSVVSHTMPYNVCDASLHKGWVVGCPTLTAELRSCWDLDYQLHRPVLPV